MPKSLLTTAKIRSRWEAGVSIAKIAREANVTRTTVLRRLVPEPNRGRALRLCNSLNDDERRDRTAAQREKRRQAQEKSVKLARKRDVPWSDEEFEYLRENGRSMTALELAINLGRTFYAVLEIAKKKKISLRN